MRKNLMALAKTIAAAAAFAACLLALFSFASLHAAAQQNSSAASQLESSIRDGFTFAAVGDLLLATPESANANPDFQAQLKILRGADLAFGNFEGSALDIRHFKGAPQAESGGTWLVAAPTVPADVKKMGFAIVNRANNHDTDWGVEGMQETDRLLDEAGLVHAGTGKDLASARAPQYLMTSSGRVGIVGMTATFPPMSVAADPKGVVPGRPGGNGLRTTKWMLVTPDVMQALVQFHNGLPDLASKPVSATPVPAELSIPPEHFRLSDHMGYAFEMNQDDLTANLRAIRQGKESSDFLIAAMHCHEPGNWSATPPDFLISLAHQAIDSGADVFAGQGPHQLRGIEIYKGKPIFYSLGNYFFERYQQQVITPELYAQFHADPDTSVPAEFQDMRTTKDFNGAEFFTSVIAVSTYRHGHVSEIRLYPIDLGMARHWSERGVPYLASAQVAQSILQRLADESKPFGTTIAIEGSVGVIRVSAAP